MCQEMLFVVVERRTGGVLQAMRVEQNSMYKMYKVGP